MKEVTCYSDFPMPADFPNYLPHSKFLEYLRLYVDHFRLEQYIRFETEVVSVEQRQDDGGRWSVMTRKMKDSSSDTATEIFDVVMVCTGINSHQNMPSFDGQEEFKGQLIHSASYRQASLTVNPQVEQVSASADRPVSDVRKLESLGYRVALFP